MEFGVIIAARTGSARLPGKVLLPLMGLPVLVFLLRRLKTSQMTSRFIVATTDRPEDNSLAEVAEKEGARVFRGSSDNVLGRYVLAARGESFDYAVRATGDCPFIDGTTLDRVLKQCVALPSYDLVSTKPAFPHGIDYEIYPKVLFEQIDQDNPTPEEREHICNYIYSRSGQYNIVRLTPPSDMVCAQRLFLLDTPEDYSRMCRLLDGEHDIHISPADVIRKYNHEN